MLHPRPTQHDPGRDWGEGEAILHTEPSICLPPRTFGAEMRVWSPGPGERQHRPMGSQQHQQSSLGSESSCGAGMKGGKLMRGTLAASGPLSAPRTVGSPEDLRPHCLSSATLRAFPPGLRTLNTGPACSVLDSARCVPQISVLLWSSLDVMRGSDCLVQDLWLDSWSRSAAGTKAAHRLL